MIAINRNPKRNNGCVKWAFLMSPESQRRAEEHLKSIGYDLDKVPKLIWPDGAVRAYRDHFYGEWKFIFRTDIMKRKLEIQERSLWFKRTYSVVEMRYLYVWTFWCPGFFGFAFRGWWTYIIGRNISYGKDLEQNEKIVNRLMELFPAENSLFGPTSFDKWQQWFVKSFRVRKKWCGKPQGKAAVLVEVRGGDHIEEIIKRVDWPA